MRDAQVTASRIYTVEDIVNDASYQERKAIITVDDPELGPLRMQGVIPMLTRHAGKVWRSGPALGEDTDTVLADLLGLGADAITDLRERGVV
jgi:crotonobetainyl-CoA:carnitine CoA-transferase CaiB-like acyl-CoA transferase